jgi:UDP-sugar transporter A1/2/3
LGVAIVQNSGSGDGAETKSETHDSTLSTIAADIPTQKRFMGLLAVLCAACTSGFSGVYFERILKGAKTSLWLRNIQMGLPSVVIAFITVFAKDANAIRSNGFFAGYNAMVWTVIMVQAAGGLIVAVVVKYADNVLKVFATSFSIIFSSLVSAVLFNFRPDFSFCSGATLVMISTVLYSQPQTMSKLRFRGARRKNASAELPLHNAES